MAMMGQKMLDYFIAKWGAANGPAVFIPYEPATTLYCIGGVADGEGHRVPADRHDWMIPERSMLSVDLLVGIHDGLPVISNKTRATRYVRRLWKHHPDLPTFEFLTPGDWTDDQITDHLTGGKYGCDRRPRPQASSHPAKASDPGDSPRRATAVAAYSAAFRAALFTIEDAGTRAGEITAWRCWELRGPRLGSTYMTNVWNPAREMEGDVTIDGVHAFKHPLTALAYMLDFCENPRPGAWRVAAYAFGSVDLYGEVIEHEIGYRAQYARVASIESAHAAHGPDCSPPDREALDHMLNAARDLYGVAPPGPRA